MHLVFDIFQGVGISAAVGIRPFLPGLVVAGLASADVQIHFDHSGYAFLQSLPMVFVLVIAAVLLLSAERGFAEAALTRGPVMRSLQVLALALGAVFFAGALARGGYTVWPGFPAGVLCALIALLATRPLLARVRARLGAGGASTLSVYAEVTGMLVALLSIIAPPVGPIVLALLVWLLVAGRSRSQQKYAGLRILR